MYSESETTGPTKSSSPPVEVELKLVTDAEGISALAETPVLGGRPTVRRIESTYYDTADRRLAGRGIALRVRKVGRRYIQTIKTAGKGSAGGLSRRGEWEWPVTSATPDLSVIDDHAVVGMLGLIRPNELRAVYSTKVRRSTHILRLADTTIELALDDGEIVAGSRRQPLHEVELELQEGDIERLYEVALDLHYQHPLGIDPRSKAARGEALAADSAPAPRFQSPVDLPPDVTVDDGLAAMLGDCLTQWTENLPAALDGTDPEGIHQARVALRRLRSAVQLFRPVIGAADHTSLKNQVRDIAGAMGPARDLDVFIDEILGPVAAAMPDDQSLVLLGKAAETLRQNGYQQAHTALAGPQATEMALRVGHWIATRGWRQQPYSPMVEWLDRPMVDLADKLLHKRLRAVLKRGRGFKGLPEAERHEVRIATKKLRYAVDFCSPLYEARSTKSFFKQLKRLQTLLGHLQDQAMAASVLGQLESEEQGPDLARAIGLVSGWHAHAMTTLAAETNAEWNAFTKTKPFWHE
ncbi:MAG: CYTH and CHAD domain-containing protein [Pseudomonadota bacterium]